MPIEIDINKFQGVGIYIGDDEKEYLIMVDQNLPESRKAEIVWGMFSRKIDVEGHMYIPDKEIHDKLRIEWR